MYRDISIVLDFINYQNSMQNVDHRPTSVSLLISPTQPNNDDKDGGIVESNLKLNIFLINPTNLYPAPP